MGSLASEAATAITIEVLATDVADLSNEAFVTSSATDSDLSNNRSTVGTMALVPNGTEEADVSVNIFDEEDPINPDRVSGRGITTWNMSVINRGPDLAIDVIVTSRLDVMDIEGIPDTTLDAFIDRDQLQPMKGMEESDEGLSSCQSCTCTFCMGQDCANRVKLQNITTAFSEDELVLICELGNLTAGENFSLEFSAALTQGIHTNTASVRTTTFDSDLSNNDSAAVTTVAVPAGGPPRGDEGGDESGCFIATAAYGSPLAAEVDLLRQFRDRFLLPFTAGQFLVRAYYFSSPPLAALISRHSGLQAVMRVILWPVVKWAHLTLTSPLLGMAVLVAGLLVTGTLAYEVIWACRQYRRRGSL
ncbi:MAG: CFI-box-CTERM domain-containing protein, partial [Saprospiraceae bacterium]|nr:CFI-box-CTERM domain-containing protein [Saprospiraceae bacterium]